MDKRSELIYLVWSVVVVLIGLLLGGLICMFTQQSYTDAATDNESSSVEYTATNSKPKIVAEPMELTDEMAAESLEMSATAVSFSYAYYPVPLDEALQHYIFEVCEEYGVEPAVIIAMIFKESTYRADCMGDNGRSFGLMQIQERWHRDRMRDLGVSDLLDPYQNVAVGIDYFTELYMYGQGLEWTLMAYNGGVAYANRMAGEGRVSTYAKNVIAKSHELGWREW